MPWGFVGGLMSMLPFLLAKHGLSFNRISQIMAFLHLPLNFSFLLMPLLDSGWTRRRYTYLFIVVTAIFTALGTILLSSSHPQLAIWILLIAFLAIRLYDGAVSGWIAQFTTHIESGAVGAWDVVVENAGGTLFPMLLTFSLTRLNLPKPIFATGVGILVLLAAWPVLRFPPAEPAHFRFREVLTNTLSAVWRAVRRPECLIGFLLFASPIGTGAAVNLQDALAKDFHTPDATVIWIAGIGSGIFGCLGAPIGGKLATIWNDRVPYVYLFSSLGIAAVSVLTAGLPRTATAFVVSMSLGSLAWGCQIAAYEALTLELAHNSPVAATQFSLFASAFYVSQSYMSLADGAAYKHGGVSGLFLVDGLSGILAAIPIFFVIRSYLARKTADAFVAA